MGVSSEQKENLGQVLRLVGKDSDGRLKALTARECKLIDTKYSILNEPENAEIAYFSKRLIQCTLPHKDPGNVRVWRRVNGSCVLRIRPFYRPDDINEQKPLYPYGTVPRLVLAWINNEVVRTKEKRLFLGSSMAEFLTELGLDPNRGGKKSDRQRVREQTERLIRSTISFDDVLRTKDGKIRQSMGEDMQIGRKSCFWWDVNDSTDDKQQDLFESWIELSEEFYQTIMQSAFPYDHRVLNAFKNSALGIDLYHWLCYRQFQVNKVGKPVFVPWKALAKQFGCEYKSVKNFGMKAREKLHEIQLLYPGLDLQFPRGGLELRPGELAIPEANHLKIK